MVPTVWKRRALAASIVGVVVGCNSVLQHITDELDGTDGNGFARVDSTFSDAPVSPGGTGGVVEDNPELIGEETRSFFKAFQIDPEAEDTAGPKFVVAADIDQDGLLDLVSGWNQSQPVQLHLQRRDADDNISFRTISLGGTTPIAIIAGIEVGQINDDGWLDIVVLSKASGFVTLCPAPPGVISRLEGQIIVLFSPGNAGLIPDGDRWTEMILVNPLVQDPWIHNQFPGIETQDFEDIKTKPEWDGFTALVVAEIDGRPGDDIIVALNPGECEGLGQKPPTNTVDLWVNPGPGLAEQFDLWGTPLPSDPTRRVPVAIMRDAPQIKDIAVMDVDSDGDLDVVACFSNSISRNVRWTRNPFIPAPGGRGGSDEVVAGFSEVVDSCDGGVNDGGSCPNGNLDCLGVPDGDCVGSVCVGGANNGQTCADSSGCLGIPNGICETRSWRFISTSWQPRPIGQVDTGADVIALGDIDGDGFDDVLVRSTEGQIVQWFRRPNPLVVQPEFPPNDAVPDRFNFPWPVFTLTEFTGQEPEAIAIGDLNGDGQMEIIAAAEGAVFWYDGTLGNSVYDPWAPNTIIQDSPPADTDGTTAPAVALEAGDTPGLQPPPGSGVGVATVDTSTHVNTLLVVDLDADGRNDIIGTLDRRVGSGLSDDRLVWYRNVRTLPEAPSPKPADRRPPQRGDPR